MKKTILALQGARSSGKTTTIGLLHEFLTDKLLTEEGHIPIYTDFEKPKVVNGKLKQKDFHAVFLINKILIGIASAGDNPPMVKKNLHHFTHPLYTILICACRSLSTENEQMGRISVTRAAVEDFANEHGYEPIFVAKKPKEERTEEKRTKEEQYKINYADAKRLLAKIKELISNQQHDQ